MPNPTPIPRAKKIAETITGSFMTAFLVCASLPSFAQAQTQTYAQASPQMRSEAMALMQACRADYQRLCSDVVPGGGRILACLHLHAGALSAACAQAMPRADALKDSAAAAGVQPR